VKDAKDGRKNREVQRSKEERQDPVEGGLLKNQKYVDRNERGENQKKDDGKKNSPERRGSIQVERESKGLGKKLRKRKIKRGAQRRK